jgi:nanoRNase/pAp phosphatase (c-di-AMP/oligoRNAs hydrolase)
MFESISELLSNVGDISQVRDLFASEFHISEKIARLKSAQRMEYYRYKGWIIVTSMLGSFQSSGARALISLGADVAIVTGKDKNMTRASLRSTNQFFKKTGIQLGELVSHISMDLDGEGSGHSTAAGFNGFCEAQKFNDLILQKLEIMLS